MLLLLRRSGDLDGETMRCLGGADGQRHVPKPRLRTTLLGWDILGRYAGAAGGESRRRED
jgi:hypothetical protein